MKILELLGTGGVGTEDGTAGTTVVTELSNALVRNGHDVTVPDPATTKERSTLDPRVNLIELRVFSPLWGPPARTPRFPRIKNRLERSKHYRNTRAMWRHLRYVQASISRVRLRDYDIVHTHHGKQAYWLANLYRRPYVYTSHWSFSVDDHGFDANVERQIVNKAELAIGLGGNYLSEFAPEANVQVISNGISLDKWELTDRAEARRELGYADSDFVILFVGMIAQHKGVDVLIDAAMQLIPEIKDLKVCIVGAPLTGAFSELMQERAKGTPIEFPGFVPYRSLAHRRYLAAADIFVTPGLHEGQSLATLEALAMGTPVVAAKVGGMGQAINDNVGILVPPRDSAALAGAISSLYRNPQRLIQLRQCCREHVEKHFTWDVAARKYIDAFSGLRHSSRRTGLATAI